MTNKDFAFVSISDAGYFEPLQISIQQAKKYYPDSSFYVYDTGLNESQKKILDQTDNVERIEWHLRFVETRINKKRDYIGKKILAFTRDYFKNLLSTVNEFSSYNNIIKEQEFEIKIFNNFLITEHFNNTYKKDFIFIDADAFIVAKFDELFESDFDIGITVRLAEELEFKFNSCRVLNSGVIFFLGGHQLNKSFIDAWKNELLNTREAIAIQTSQVRMIEKQFNRDVFSSIPKTISFQSDTNIIRVALLPCEVYNFNWIEKFDMNKHKDRVKILHFKSGRFKTPLFIEITEQLGIKL